MSTDKHDHSATDSASVESLEKGNVVPAGGNAALSKYTQEQIDRTWKKVDWYIMPVSILLYLASYIDR